jgi:hypothetical protein
MLNESTVANHPMAFLLRSRASISTLSQPAKSVVRLGCLLARCIYGRSFLVSFKRNLGPTATQLTYGLWASLRSQSFRLPHNHQHPIPSSSHHEPRSAKCPNTTASESGSSPNTTPCSFPNFTLPSTTPTSPLSATSTRTYQTTAPATSGSAMLAIQQHKTQNFAFFTSNCTLLASSRWRGAAVREMSGRARRSSCRAVLTPLMALLLRARSWDCFSRTMLRGVRRCRLSRFKCIGLRRGR